LYIGVNTGYKMKIVRQYFGNDITIIPYIPQ